MDHYEMVENLRTKANVTYEEAKAALEASDWDILDALVLLENEGKVNNGETKAEYTTQEKPQTKAQWNNADTKAKVSDGLSKLWAWIKKLFTLGNSNQFTIRTANVMGGLGEASNGIGTTGITSVHGAGLLLHEGAWYSLDGRQLVGKPAAKGVYIHNGEKVIVR